MRNNEEIIIIKKKHEICLRIVIWKVNQCDNRISLVDRGAIIGRLIRGLVLADSLLGAIPHSIVNQISVTRY